MHPASRVISLKHSRLSGIWFNCSDEMQRKLVLDALTLILLVWPTYMQPASVEYLLWAGVLSHETTFIYKHRGRNSSRVHRA